MPNKRRNEHKLLIMRQKSFQDLYNEAKQKPTAAQIFISEVAELTHRSENTVRMWLVGRQTPDELTKSVIAEKYHVSIESLFKKH